LLTITSSLIDTFGIKTIYGQLHHREGNIYVPFENEFQIKNMVMEHLCINGCESLVGKYFIEEIIYLLESSRIVPIDQVNPDNCFPVQNGFLRFNNDGHVELFNDESLVFTFISQIPYLKGYDTSKIKEFLSLTIPNESEQRHVLEACAIAMFPWLRYWVNYKRFLILYGTTDNGKSILCDNIIPYAIGNKAVSNIRYKRLNERFSLAQIVGCRMNISTENDGVYINDEENIKSITSGDSQEFERKYCHPFKARVFVVLIFCMNEEPQFGRIGEAMKNRTTLVNFPNQFSKNSTDPRFEANPELKDINSEIIRGLQQGMLVLLVDTAERLYREKALTESDLSKLEELQLASNHIRDFVDQHYSFDPTSVIPSGEVFETDYRGNYCAINCLYDPNRGTWTDPSDYDPVARTAAQLSRKIKLLFPNRIVLEKNSKGARVIKGLKHTPRDYRKKPNE